MKKLTFEECKKHHHQMWTDLADGKIMEKEYFEFPDIGEDWEEYAYCFLCYWSFINALDGDNICNYCPGEWPSLNNGKGVTPCHNSWYGMWLEARKEGRWKRAREIAQSIAYLPWRESGAVLRKAHGKVIRTIYLVAPRQILVVEFEDGSGIQFEDKGQSCCEERYMASDDNLADFCGAAFLGMEIKAVPSLPWEKEKDGAHDIEFLCILTSKGEFVITNHNEHNGYYAGFDIRVAEKERGINESR